MIQCAKGLWRKVEKIDYWTWFFWHPTLDPRSHTLDHNNENENNNRLKILLIQGEEFFINDLIIIYYLLIYY